MTSLLHHLGDLDVHTMAYADDLVLVVEAESRAAVENKTNVALARVTQLIQAAQAYSVSC